MGLGFRGGMGVKGLPTTSHVVPFWLVYCNPLRKNHYNPKHNFEAVLGVRGWELRVVVWGLGFRVKTLLQTTRRRHAGSDLGAEFGSGLPQKNHGIPEMSATLAAPSAVLTCSTVCMYSHTYAAQ